MQTFPESAFANCYTTLSHFLKEAITNAKKLGPGMLAQPNKTGANKKKKRKSDFPGKYK